MRSIAALLLLVFNAHFAFGQLPQWATYINDRYVTDIELEGDIAWVGSYGGLTKLNRVTGEKESFLPTTINLVGLASMR